MPNNNLILKTIYDLREEAFWIPSYQRGFRWTSSQVLDLLNDVHDFVSEKTHSHDAFYCLQPIVVRKRDDHWEVIDGQQRLTTLYLILNFLNLRLIEDRRNKIHTIEYETRPGSHEYLATLDEAQKDENIDYFHMFDASAHIDSWFVEHKNKINDIESAFQNAVKIIWYEVPDDVDPIQIFTRLNMGKIPLTNSELVKALFLQSRNYSTAESSQSDTEIIADEKDRIRIAHEWDEIERTLQSDELWYFLNDKSAQTNRIEFILNLVAVQYDLPFEVRRDKASTFIAFYRQRDDDGRFDALTVWAEVKKAFMDVLEWHADSRLFHLIGYLIFCRYSVVALKKVATSSGTKSAFRRALKAIVFEQLFSEDINALDDQQIADCVAGNLQELDYQHGGSSATIRRVLLLFNIVTLLRNSRSNQKFQFDRFKKEKWDIEHIKAVASGMPSNVPDQKRWLDNFLSYCLGHDFGLDDVASLSDIDDENIKELYERAKTLLKEEPFNPEEFGDLFEDVVRKFDPPSDDSGEHGDNEVDHGIGNLTLLDQTTNRSYKNAIFPIKRKRIIELEKRGGFIPICTRNVFLKYYSDDVTKMLFWTDNDAEDYTREMTTSISAFFTEND